MTVKMVKTIYDTEYTAGKVFDENTMPKELLQWAVDKGYAVDVETIAKDEKASGGLKNLSDALASLKAENESLKAEIAALKKSQK